MTAPQLVRNETPPFVVADGSSYLSLLVSADGCSVNTGGRDQLSCCVCTTGAEMHCCSGKGWPTRAGCLDSLAGMWLWVCSRLVVHVHTIPSPSPHVFVCDHVPYPKCNA